MSSQPRLVMRNIKKSFGGVPALQNGNLQVHAGQVHALMGANGAGKSTLMNILGGVFPHDSGDIIVEGETIKLRHARDATENGIAFVHQELTMMPSMSVAENIFIDEFPKQGFRIDFKTMHARAKQLLASVGCDVPTTVAVEQLSTGTRQLIEIARALKKAPKIVIFDEPTSSLSAAERTHLFKVIAQLKANGTAVVYISHFLDEVFQICDFVTVMRNGQTVSTCAVADSSVDEVLTLMLGDVAEEARLRPPTLSGASPLVSVQGLTRGSVLTNISFDLRPGEVVGLWGLLGSGRTELIRAMMGLDSIDAGSITFRTAEGAEKISPDQLRVRTGLVTEDRRGEGLVLPFSIARNITLPFSGSLAGRSGLIDEGAENELAQSLMKRLGVKANSPTQVVGTLSGGNQQKVVFARWLQMRPKLFILDEPTRGLDVGAKGEIMKLIIELAQSGVAVLMISSEPEEIMRVSDRYLILNRGRITGQLPGDASKAQLMQAVSTQSAEIGAVA
ncbi:Galactose/methyl galactoside import ATP-binding protein MglA [Pseudomonas syringae pv. actinidiae]|uniref:sugar ABC transporter ATP-binding protein n=1 Tax=Pseudomonas syringae TaxID=317 RepID=UPI000A23D4F4|nr:sugar ABC transporter ATP-binding protein [Pseudomonas syringae]OSR68732.1 Galactose/methyl galactoside import ATP-binding protein MglA [Pseudomonas syringae pv. actinidiae]